MSPLNSPADNRFTHLDANGQVCMVDVSSKPETVRQAIAEGSIFLGPKVFPLLLGGSLKKGDALAAARLAGIMAVKNTSQLIPLCHVIPITAVEIDFSPDYQRLTLNIKVMVRAQAKTGVEMEALTGAAAAALTIYDMCKAIDRSMVIEKIRLVQKSGGKSGNYTLGATAPSE
ncbi:cyclic pyranopterin monophosphate synthase MoaC [Desulfobacca acetoxidans]